VKALVILAWLAVPAFADPKPTIAVAGIDGADSESVPLATTLTRTLQSMKTGRYQVKGTAKQIAAALVKAECRVTQTACAVAVGSALGVDYVLAGEVTKRGKHQVLVLALVNVTTKQRVRSIRENVASSIDAKRWGRMLYQKLVEAELGELTVATNAQQGEIVIDGHVVGALFEGRATLNGIAIGTHQLVIRAKGFKPLELDVTVDGQTRLNLLLEPAP
jgi:TolB-like protein